MLRNVLAAVTNEVTNERIGSIPEVPMNSIPEVPMNSIPIKSTIKPVPPKVFASKFTESANMILEILGGMVIPIVSICFLLSIITYIMGGILHSDKIRKTGAAGIGTSALGYLLYMLSPYFMGLLYNIGQIFQ